jgi:hypothetical protein
MDKKQLLMGTALAAFVVGAAGCGGMNKSSGAGMAAKGECAGVNACKGQGECGGAGHGCAGKNACKGQGWLGKTSDECKAAGGTFTAK